MYLGGSGDTGPSGLQGFTGLIGQRGFPGATGGFGWTGSTGPTGNPGNRGLQGEPGVQGPQGRLGPAGQGGLDGPIGQPGPPGQPGPRGKSLYLLAYQKDGSSGSTPPPFASSKFSDFVYVQKLCLLLWKRHTAKQLLSNCSSLNLEIFTGEDLFIILTFSSASRGFLPPNSLDQPSLLLFPDPPTRTPRLWNPGYACVDCIL